jgi:serine/threonine protein kinase, bacterial
MVEVVSLARGMEPYPGYVLRRILGRGALGEVWQTTGPRDRDVAVKFLPCDSRSAAAHEVRALQSVRQLKHPHLVGIHRIWCGAGYLAVVMELAEGSLLDLLQIYREDCGAAMPGQHLCPLMLQAASALDFLNTRQHHLNDQLVAVRHCDVKPSNLLVQGGKVKVADFSLSVQTATPMWYSKRAGTLDYAAPEVFQGWLSDRTDQYALAVSYCQMRTGRLPFHDTPPNFERSYTRAAPDLAGLSPAEQLVLIRALDTVPQNRWPSCTDLVGHLSRAVQPS